MSEPESDSDQSSNPEEINFNITNDNPQDSDFHILKSFISKLIHGLPNYKNVNPSEVARHIISMSGKIGNVLVNVQEDSDEEKDGPSSAKKSKKETEKEKDQPSEEEPEEDSVLGITTLITEKNIPEPITNLFKKSNSFNFDSETHGWLINERLEALPFSVGISMLKSTLSTINNVYPKIKNILIIVRALTKTKNEQKIENLQFVNDEFSLIFDQAELRNMQSKGKKNKKSKQTENLIKNYQIYNIEGEAARRGCWEDANPELDPEESDESGLFQCRAILEFDYQRLLEVLDELVFV